MKKISEYVMLKSELCCDGKKAWKAYWRGTNNRIKYDTGTMVFTRTKQGDLRFDLFNNPMEQGVILDV